MEDGFYGEKASLPEQAVEPARQNPINGTLYLVLSILATLLCCFPFGIVGIVYSSRINTQQDNGDYEGARVSAKLAKVFLGLSLALGIIVGCAAAAFLTFMGIKKDLNSDVSEYYEDAQLNPEYGEDGSDGELDGITGEVKPAKPVSELGDNWASYTVQINDSVLALPCEYKDLEAAGLTIDDSFGLDNDGMVSGGGYLIGNLADEKGNSMTVEFINADKEEKKAQECLVGGITVGEFDLKEDGFKVSFPGNVRIGDEKKDVVEKYGEPEETYEGDELHTYIWSDSEMYYSTVEIDFDSGSGKLVQMSIKKYGNGDENDAM